MPPEFQSQIDIPRVEIRFKQPDDNWFWDNEMLGQDLGPGYGLTSGRIFPVSFSVRSALVSFFAPPKIKNDKKAFLARPE